MINEPSRPADSAEGDLPDVGPPAPRETEFSGVEIEKEARKFRLREFQWSMKTMFLLTTVVAAACSMLVATTPREEIPGLLTKGLVLATVLMPMEVLFAAQLFRRLSLRSRILICLGVAAAVVVPTFGMILTFYAPRRHFVQATAEIFGVFSIVWFFETLVILVVLRATGLRPRRLEDVLPGRKPEGEVVVTPPEETDEVDRRSR